MIEPRPTPGEPGRARRMAERIRRTARERGMSHEAVAALDEIHHAAMAPRIDSLTDDHDPRYLHPGRVAAILMDDLEIDDPDWIALGMVMDSANPELEVSSASLPAELSRRRAALPRPGEGDRLLESLVVLEAPELDVVLAERLDHLRHLHLMEDRERARQIYRQAVVSYSKVASRAHPVLARRYAWWTSKFSRLFET